MSVVPGEPPVETPCCCRDLAALVDALQEEVRQLRREVGTLRAEAGYRTNGRRLEHSPGSTAFREEDAQLRHQLAAMDQQADEELADAKLRRPCRKVLQSLREHREGLARFVDHPEIPMDNHASERAGRGPAVGRKNYYGSGSLWSARLAARMFSLVATLKLWELNPRAWLTWYFEPCAAVGGQAPADIQDFLPWSLSAQQRAALRIDAVDVSDLDTS